MRLSIVPALFWGYWASIVYIIGMIGYLIIDTSSYIFVSMNTTLSFVVYMILAFVFVIDAFLYTIDWYTYAILLRKNKNEPIRYRAEFFACILQNFGSYLYLIGAILGFNKSRFIRNILVLNLVGIIAFLLECGCILFGWHITLKINPPTDPKRGCVIQDVYMWAHTMNIVASAIYLCATALACHLYVTQAIISSDRVLLLQMFGDLVYLFDAYLYHQCWQRDQRDFDANTERQKLIKLEEQLTANDHLSFVDNDGKNNEKK